MDATPPENPYLPPTAPGALPPDFEFSSPDTNLPQPHLGWVALIIVGFFIYLLIVGTAMMLVIVVWLVVTSDLPQDELMRELPKALLDGQGQELLIFAASASTCLFAFVLSWAVHRGATGRRVAMRWPNLWQILLVLMAFLPLGIIVSEINNWLIPIVPTFGGAAMEQMMLRLARMPLPLVVIGVCIFPAVGEELLFRGFIGRGLVGRYGPVVGVSVTSILFGFVHIHPPQVICTAILGVALHVVYLWTKSLLAPMLLHFLNNLFAMISMRYSDTLPIPGVSVVGENGVIHTSIALTLASLAVCALLMFLLYQTRSGWLAKDGGSYPFGYPTAEAPADETARITSPQPNLAIMFAAVASFGGLMWLLGTIVRQWVG